MLQPCIHAQPKPMSMTVQYYSPATSPTGLACTVVQASPSPIPPSFTHPIPHSPPPHSSLLHPPLQMGSPTTLADSAVEKVLVEAAREGRHGLYVPAGAFWGGQDVQKMADRGTLKVGTLLLLLLLLLLPFPILSPAPLSSGTQSDDDEAPLSSQTHRPPGRPGEDGPRQTPHTV